LAAAPGVSQDGLEINSSLRTMVDRYLTSQATQYWQARTKALAALRTPTAVADRQKSIRAQFIELLGEFPPPTPLNPRITSVLHHTGYRIEKLIFESQPKFYVTANVYVPEPGRGPFPAVLGAAGHSQPGKAFWVYQSAWAGLARRGFVVLAFDPVGQGERTQNFDPELEQSRVGGSTAEHTLAGIQCLLTGTPLARYFVWDGIRAIDYLLTRDDVDAARIAVTGNSGGGTQAAYLALAEPRLAAAAPACYMTSSEKLWTDPGPQDAEQNVPGFISAGLDLADFSLAFAPKPFLFLAATRDFFPIAGTHAAFAEARQVYQVLGHPERVDLFEYDDEHGFSKPRREAMYRWFERWLMGREDKAAEQPFEAEDPAALSCTPTGQLATSLGGETVQSINRALAERLAGARRTPVSPALIVERLSISTQARTLPAIKKFDSVARNGYVIDKIALETEPGITVPALVFVPASPGPKPALIHVSPEGKASDLGEFGDLLTFVHAGRVVLAPDLRGWGDSRPPSAYSTLQRALLIGKTTIGMRVLDLLGCFDYLASRPDVDGSDIGVVGKGAGGVTALYAAALEPRIARTAVEGAPLSYLNLARDRFTRMRSTSSFPGF
jgi:dienelactone hydrolase